MERGSESQRECGAGSVPDLRGHVLVECPHCQLLVRAVFEPGAELFHERCGKMIVLPDRADAHRLSELSRFEAGLPEARLDVSDPAREAPAEDESAAQGADSEPQKKARLERKRSNREMRKEFKKMRNGEGTAVAAIAATALPSLTSSEMEARAAAKAKDREMRNPANRWDAAAKKPFSERIAHMDSPLVAVAACLLGGGLIYGLIVLPSLSWGTDGADVALAEVEHPAEWIEPKEIVSRFLDRETTLDERLAFLREPVDPVEVRDHFATHGAEVDSGIAALRHLGQKQMLDVGYHRYHVNFRNGGDRLLCLVDTPEGWRIDWDAFARTGSRSWDELLAGDHQVAEMQVLVSPGKYYNFGFSDPEQHSAFVLSSPDREGEMFGYARRHSLTEKIALQISGQVRKSRGKPMAPVPMVLRLESVDGSHQRRQFLITHVVASSWVESRVGTVEDLWLEPELQRNSFGDGTELAGGNEAQLMYQQGLSLLATDRTGAIQYFRKALQYRNDYPENQLALAASLVELDQLDEAEDHLRAVLGKDNTIAVAHYHLGICALKRKDAVKAIASFESAVAQDPDHLPSLNLLAWFLASHKDEAIRRHPRVVRMAEHALEIGDAVPAVLATLGVAYAAAGRYEDAVEATGKALGLVRESYPDADLEAMLTKRLILFRERQSSLFD